MKRGDWVQVSHRINHFGDRKGRIVGVNDDGLAHHVEYGVQFEAGGVVAWFIADELAPIPKPKGKHLLPLPDLRKLRREHLVASLH